MSDITLAKDVNDFGDKPAGTSDSEWQLFQSRRRGERMQLDIDAAKASANDRVRWTSEMRKKERGWD